MKRRNGRSRGDGDSPSSDDPFESDSGDQPNEVGGDLSAPGEEQVEDSEVIQPDEIIGADADDIGDLEVNRGPLPAALLAASGALMVVGLLLMLVVLPLAFRSESARCDLARSFIKDANDNDRDWDDVDLDGRSTKDLECSEALRLAETIWLDEDGSVTRVVPSAESIRNQGIITGVLGAGQVASGAAVIFTRNRRARNTAVAFAFVSLIVPLLGMVSIALVLAIVYGLVFSPAARARWPKKRFGRP
ncbi:MAG: hypothetical protein WC184_10860 [Acidimicrobiia bacterium]